MCTSYPKVKTTKFDDQPDILCLAEKSGVLFSFSFVFDPKICLDSIKETRPNFHALTFHLAIDGVLAGLCLQLQITTEPN